MTLTNRDLVELTAWRRKLHQHPETSNEEEMTAKEVIAFLADTRPDKVLTALAGTAWRWPTIAVNRNRR